MFQSGKILNLNDEDNIGFLLSPFSELINYDLPSFPNEVPLKYEDIASKNITIKNTNETDKTIKKPKKLEKIFNIKKKNKKRGRLSHKRKETNFGVQHDKFSDDNILRKIKVRFLKNLIIFINLLYSTYKKENSTLILMIDSSVSKNINRSTVLKWLNKKVKDALSCKISSKYKKYDSNENKNKIRQFYENEKNNPKLIQILEMKIKDIYEIYIKEENEEGFEKFKNFDYDKKQLEKEMLRKNEDKIKEYLELYQIFAKNFEKKFIAKAIRKYNKNKKD